MSKYELQQLIDEFNKLRATYSVETKEQLDNMYFINKEVHARLLSMYLTLTYYCR